MPILFISYAQEDADYVEILRKKLELQGYQCWRDPDYPKPTDFSYPHMIECAILGSAALVLVWSAHAAQTPWVIRHLYFAQQLKKAILSIVLDGTAFTHMFSTMAPIAGMATSDEVVTQLLPFLPTSDSQDPLLLLAEKAAHDFISNRYTAIDLSADMLTRNEHREEILAILEYLSQHDSMLGVREKAQEVLDVEKQKMMQVPPPMTFGPEDVRHIFQVTCKLCKHSSYFDKRWVCAAQKISSGGILRSKMPIRRDEMELPCEKCGHLMPTHVDCEGYW